MGTIIKYNMIHQSERMLRIYCSPTSEIIAKAVSFNKKLALELINIKPDRRTMQLENCFLKVLDEVTSEPVIKDIDVMFNPSYKVDVMKVITSAYKQKHFSLIWPGIYSDGKLTYSEECYPDYKVYEIMEYDITCVIQ